MAIEEFSRPNQEEEDWEIPPRIVDEGEMFRFTAQYKPAEFLRIVRILIERHLRTTFVDADLVSVLEAWEKRIHDVVDNDPAYEQDISIGFARGEDQVTRLVVSVASK